MHSNARAVQVRLERRVSIREAGVMGREKAKSRESIIIPHINGSLVDDAIGYGCTPFREALIDLGILEDVHHACPLCWIDAGFDADISLSGGGIPQRMQEQVPDRDRACAGIAGDGMVAVDNHIHDIARDVHDLVVFLVAIADVVTAFARNRDVHHDSRARRLGIGRQYRQRQEEKGNKDAGHCCLSHRVLYVKK